MSASNAEKDSIDFGLQFAKYIESEWMTTDQYEMSKTKIQLLRDHMMGTVNTDRFKPMFTKGNDASALNLNWKYPSEMPKFITSITEGFSYDMYRTVVKGIDAYSNKQRTTFKEEKLKDMYTKDKAAELSDMFGQDFMPQGYVPSSKEEMNVYMELEYRLASEIALELAIQKVFDINDWQEVFNQLCEELALIGKGIIRCEYDADQVLKLGYVRPENFIHSIDLENTRDRRATYYMGEVRTLTVSDVIRLVGDRMTKEQINQLAASSKGSMVNSVTEFTDDMLESQVSVIQFCFPTSRDRIYKKKGNRHGGKKMLRKNDDWRPVEESRSILINNPYEVWYEGVYVCGTEIMLSYGMMDNIARNPKSRRKALPPYTMYKLSTESIGSRVMSITDEIYITLIKLRQLQLKLIPEGYAIDIDALGNVKTASGQVINEVQQIQILTEDGNYIYSGSDLIDDTGSRPPFHILPGSSGAQLAQLVDIYNMHVQHLHEITGVNPQFVGGAPPPRTSEGVYKGTISSTQKVINNVYNGLLNIQQRLSETIVSRIQNAAVLKETKPIIDNLLGEHTTDMVAEIANMHMYQYVLNTDVKPTDQERQQLVQDLAMALQAGTITIGDKIDIQNVSNLKLAAQMIKLREKEYRKQMERMEAIKSQNAIAEINAKTQAAAQMEQMKAQMEERVKLAEINAKGQIEAFKAQADMQKISLNGQWDVRVAQETAKAKFNLDNFKEDRKDQRTEKQATQQSEMIEQRNNNTGAKNFEEPKIPQVGASPNVEQ